MRLIGFDPGLRRTGWGLIESHGSRLRHVAHGTVVSDGDLPLSARLHQLFDALTAVLAEWRPAEAAVEETFVNKNPTTTLRLGQARAIALLAPDMVGLPVAEYPPNMVKKAVVGNGHAQKQQVAMMVGTLLPGLGTVSEDESDALAVAICHAHLRQTQNRLAAAIEAAS
ncbi:MAG: crossover junction endodeoxyribonuclease RuvC [Alphaproteobacteria bacterium]